MNDRHPEPEQLRRVAAAFRNLNLDLDLDTPGTRTIVDFSRIRVTTVVGYDPREPAGRPPQCRTIACHAGAYLHHVERTDPDRIARAGMRRYPAVDQAGIDHLAEQFDELDLAPLVAASQLDWPQPDDPDEAGAAPFALGARFIAEDLGFDKIDDLLGWTGRNPDLWGSTQGQRMFSAAGWNAFATPGRAGDDDIDLASIAAWYDAVARRVEHRLDPHPHPTARP